MFQTGLDVLIDQHLARLQGRRVGLVSHPAGVDRKLTGSAACLLKAGVGLTALFGPEHGFDGQHPMFTPVGHMQDAHTGLPIFSLYGETKEPTPEMLADVDVLLFDVQDFGARYNTFLSSLVYVLRGAAKAGKEVMVLDRPNPINGMQREGALIQPGFESFIGILPVPNRHGMTFGELALFANNQSAIQCPLSVIPMKGWKRADWFDSLGRCWVPPSPGMPRFETALIYGGSCLIEGTNLSEGRGTALPLEVAGAPWMDGFKLAGYLNGLDLPGIIFRPTSFIPTTQKFSGQPCRGIQMHVTQRTEFRPVYSGLHLLAACQKLFPGDFQLLSTSWEGNPAHLDLLMGSAHARQGILAGTPVDELVAEWESIGREFTGLAQSYFLYQ